MTLGTSLAIQRLRPLTSNAGVVDSVPGWGTKIPCAEWWAWKKKKKKKFDCRGVLLQPRQQKVLTGKTSSSKDEHTIANPRMGVPHRIALCFIVLHRYCVSYGLKVCGNPVSSGSFSTIFPTVFAHFMSHCHILVILTFQTFSLCSYLLDDLWCYYCDLLKAQMMVSIFFFSKEAFLN